MKKDVRIIFEDTAYRYMPNTSIENDVLDKVRHTIDNNKFAGNFYSSLWQGGGDGYLYELDDYDDYVVRKQNLKEGERIYRYFTRRSAIGGMIPLIKINIDKGLLYFLKPDDEGLDLIEFETKGIPVRYLNIIPPEKEEYAEGGDVESKDSEMGLDKEILKQDYDKIVASKLFDDVYLNPSTIEIFGGYETLMSYYDRYGKHYETKRVGKYFENSDIIEQFKKISGRKYNYKLTKRTIEGDIDDDEYDNNYPYKEEKIEEIRFVLTPVIKKMAEGGEVGDWKSNALGDGSLELYNSNVQIRDNGGDYGRGRYDVYKRGEYDRRTSFRPSILMASMDDLEEAKKYGYNNRYEKGGKLAWQSVEVGDNALVKSENKMGVVVVTYGRRFHLRFPDGSEKTYSAEELEFIPSDSYAHGGQIEDLVGRSITMYDMGVPEPTYYTISRVEMSPPHFAHKTLRIYHKYGNSELVDVIEDEKIDQFLNGEEVQIRPRGGDYYAIKLMKEMKKGGNLEGGVKKNMLFDKNGERRVDPEALAYIENTVDMLPQTKFMHTKENGQYTPERKKLHEEIISTFHEGKPCVNQRPAVAILTGGAPASGKTTFIKKYVDLDPEKVYHVDADEVRAMLPEYKGWNASQTHLETADLVNQLIDDIGVPCDHDLIYDGTMNKATKYEKIVDKLHKLGYKVFVVYISIPEQVSKERVIARYKKAGRYVPMKVIEEVYDMGLKAFEKVAYEMADGYIRIDGMNGEIIEQGGMSMPSNIEYEKGGKVGDDKLKNGTALVRSAERYAETNFEKPVKKGKGMARASKQDGQMKYSEVIVFFEDGEKVVFDESEFPKFFMKDGGELGGQDYYDGFQMQVVQKKGNPDKEVQKENTKMRYRKGGKL